MINLIHNLVDLLLGPFLVCFKLFTKHFLKQSLDFLPAEGTRAVSVKVLELISQFFGLIEGHLLHHGRGKTPFKLWLGLERLHVL